MACAHAQPERTARLFGAAGALRDAIGTPLPPVERASYEHNMAGARAELSEEALETWTAVPGTGRGR